MTDKRQRQLATLQAHGATDEDIQIVLGTGSEAIKPNNQTIKQHLKRFGLDVIALPVERARRLMELAKAARIEFYKG